MAFRPLMRLYASRSPFSYIVEGPRTVGNSPYRRGGNNFAGVTAECVYIQGTRSKNIPTSAKPSTGCRGVSEPGRFAVHISRFGNRLSFSPQSQIKGKRFCDVPVIL